MSTIALPRTMLRHIVHLMMSGGAAGFAPGSRKQTAMLRHHA
jgi:hypothetical protein